MIDMISVYDLEERVYGFFDKIFAGDQIAFGFSGYSSASFFVDRQTEAPRMDETTELYYRVENPIPFGSMVKVDDVVIDPVTRLERVETLRKVHVVVNVLSKSKGMSKSTMNFILAAIQTSRKAEACYGKDFDFDLPLHNIDRNIRDLTELENRAWTERIEADFYFNYKDVIEFNEQPLIATPSSVDEVKDIVSYTLELKGV